MVLKELVIRLLGGNQAKTLKSWAALIKDTNRGMDDDQLDYIRLDKIRECG